VSAAGLHSQELPRLLRRVADDQTADVIITSPGMRWLYHSYDGGTDVIATSTGHRDQLRRAHKDWLPAHPAGL
jgi:hypothetical protein